MKNALISAAVALVVSAGIWLVLPAKTPGIGAASFGTTSIDGSQSNLPNPSNYDYIVARVALGLGTSMTNSNTGAGNVNLEAVRQNIATATSTTCALKNPFNATSTIVSVNYNVMTGTSTPANGIDYIVGTSTTAFATTTNLVADAYFPAGKTGTITWDPGVNNAMVGPTNYVLVGALASSTIPTGGIITTGTCAAVFQSI